MNLGRERTHRGGTSYAYIADYIRNHWEFASHLTGAYTFPVYFDLH
jgi:hypothetical protein